MMSNFRFDLEMSHTTSTLVIFLNQDCMYGRNTISVYTWNAAVSRSQHVKYDIKDIWWCHQMETFSALLALCVGNSPVAGEFPSERPVMLSFDVYFDLRLNKRLSVDNREAGDLRRHRAHYDVTVKNCLCIWSSARLENACGELRPTKLPFINSGTPCVWCALVPQVTIS